jgi:hypothetical protein
VITAHSAQTDLLHPAMDGLALGLQQNRIVHNPSIEKDSVLEHLMHAADLLPRGHEAREEIAAAILLLGQLVKSNRAEGEKWRTVIGPCDRLVTELRATEKRQGSGFDYRTFCRDARPHLKVLASHLTTADNKARARDHLAQLVAGVPESLLLSATIRNELGVNAYTALVDFTRERVPA